MANPITRAKALQNALDVLGGNSIEEDIKAATIETLTNMLAQVTKNSSRGGKTQARKNNEALAPKVIEALKSSSVPMRARDIANAVPGIGSVSKAVAVLNVCLENGSVKKVDGYPKSKGIHYMAI